MKYAKHLFSVIVLLFAFLSVAQRQVSVRALDITQQTNLHDFTLLVIHEKDTSVMIISAENPSLTILPGSCEVVIRKEGYQVASTDKWDCPDDTATIVIEFRLLKVGATRPEVRRGRRHSRKKGIDYSLSTGNMGGFKTMRAGMGRHFTSVVYIVTNDGLSTHCVSE